MLSEVFEKIKEFVQLSPAIRASIIGYAILGGGLYWQQTIINNYQKKEDDVSELILNIRTQSELHCQQVLNETRTRYQNKFEEQRESFQNMTDSLTIEVSTLKVKLRKLNSKVAAQL